MKSLSLLLLILVVSISPACSRFSASGRQERAYAKYIKKSKSDRERRQAQFRKEKAKIPKPGETESSEPREMTQTSEGPQAVPSDAASQ
jgi:hypothetical protein